VGALLCVVGAAKRRNARRQDVLVARTKTIKGLLSEATPVKTMRKAEIADVANERCVSGVYTRYHMRNPGDHIVSNLQLKFPHDAATVDGAPVVFGIGRPVRVPDCRSRTPPCVLYSRRTTADDGPILYVTHHGAVHSRANRPLPQHDVWV